MWEVFWLLDRDYISTVTKQFGVTKFPVRIAIHIVVLKDGREGFLVSRLSRRGKVTNTKLSTIQGLVRNEEIGAAVLVFLGDVNSAQEFASLCFEIQNTWLRPGSKNTNIAATGYGYWKDYCNNLNYPTRRGLYISHDSNKGRVIAVSELDVKKSIDNLSTELIVPDFYRDEFNSGFVKVIDANSPRELEREIQKCGQKLGAR